MFLYILHTSNNSDCFILQVIRRLRDRGEPVRLFGETDYESYQRLKRLETLEPDVNKVSYVKSNIQRIQN